MATPTETRRIREGSRVPVLLEREGGPRTPAQVPPGLPAPDGDEVPLPPPEVCVYYLHCTYALRPDDINSYDQISLESSLAETDVDRAVRRNLLLANLTTVTVAGSGFARASALQVAAGTAYTDGLLAGILFTDRNGVQARRELVGLSTEWSRAVPVAVRLAEFDALIATLDPDDPARLTLTAARDTLDRERFEQWDEVALGYVRQEGTLRAAHLLTGTYTLGLASDRHLQPWDATDTVNYRVTGEPVDARDRVDPPVARVGEGQVSRVDLFAAPQVHEFLIQYLAIFLVGTEFFFSEVALAATGAFLDALPALPFAYSLATEHANAFNGYAVSQFVQNKLAYRQMLAADDAIQVFGPFFFFILVGRIEGRVTLMQVNQHAGRLCAVVQVREQRGNPLTRYIWGVTELVRPNGVIDQVALNTDEVVGANVLFVDNPL